MNPARRIGTFLVVLPLLCSARGLAQKSGEGSKPRRETAKKAKETGREAAPFRTRLRELLDCEKPASQVEINGRIFLLKDLKKRARVIAGDRESAALVEVVVIQLLKEHLNAAGCYLSDAEFEKAYTEHPDKFAGTVLNAENLATRFKGYPSVSSYRQWWRLRASFEGSIEKEITLAVLEAHVRKESVYLSEERRAVNSMFFAARHDGCWDFTGALQRARKAHAALAKGQDFDVVARAGDTMPEDRWKRKRTELQHLAGHRDLFGENEHTDWASGVSAVRSFFYASSKPGDVSKPLLGPGGYWIVRFGEHQKWKHRNFTLEIDDRQDNARQFYVDCRFREWIRQVFAKVSIKEQRGAK